MDISRAREWIAYRPTTTLAEGLRTTWQWFIANQDEYLRKQNYFKDAAMPSPGNTAPSEKLSSLT